MTFKIEKMPIPRSHRGNVRYPFGEMEVGDSFLYPDKARGTQNKINSSACWYGKRNNKKFCTRVVENGVRVWRVA